MTLLLTMLPIYLFGNLHCLGMCGPLVMMIGQHRFRYFYFLGRTLSFTLVAMLAGEMGSILNLVLKHYQIPALTSFIFGGIILFSGLCTLFGWQYPGYWWLSKRLSKINNNLSLLILKDEAWPTFFFGFFTVLLPCGQTLIVFSACALSGDALIGFINGLAFALITSPSLLVAMNMHLLFQKIKKYYNILLGLSALVIGVLAICRGLAEMDIIQHFIITAESASLFHIVLY